MRTSRILAALVLLTATAQAQTVTVTLGTQKIDVDYFTATVADLPGPDGEVSLLEALVATNHTPGTQTIAFNIPQVQWQLPFLYPGVATMTGSPSGLIATDTVIIDATTQTAFTGDTNPNGGEVAILGEALILNGPGSIVRGFHTTNLWVNGDGSLVTGNSGGTSIEVGGDGVVVQGNEAGTIKLQYASHATVIGNTMDRVRIWGLNASTPAVGNRVGGPTPSERNHITGYGYVNSDGLPSGTDVELIYTTDTLIQNNTIGTTPDGMAQGDQFQTIGVYVMDGNQRLVVRDNQIAGVLGHGQGPHWAGTLWGWGVYFTGSGDDVEFSNNTIGLDAAGNATLGSVWGFHTGSSSYTNVRLLGNAIADSYLNGVTVGAQAQEVRLLGNSIHGNAKSGSGFLGVDLLPAATQATGVSPNDPLDADAGGNGLQNWPVLVSAKLEGASTRVVGTLDSAQGRSYTLEFHASPGCDPSGHGQGELALGTLAVTTDGAGHADFDGLVAAAPPGWVVVGSATLEPTGATSEFSPCVALAGQACAADLGFGGPGSSTLSLCGQPLGSGATATLTLLGAAPGAATWIAYGTSYLPTPALGGTVVPIPGLVQFLGTTDAAGALALPVPGGGGPSTVYAQVAHLDFALPDLIGLSNALQVQFLP